MPIEDLKEKTEDLVSHVEDFANTFYKLTVVNATQKAVNLGSTIIVLVAVCTMGMFALLFAGFALSWWLGDLLQSRIGGFLLGAAFFLLVMGIVIYFRRKIIFPFIRDRIIRKIYE